MTLINILLIITVIALTNAAIITFCSLAWSMFEDTNIGSAISEWIISKFKGKDEE